MTYNLKTLKEKGDPSSIQQEFTSIRLKIWCCRYWQLRYWNSTEMAFPYWRVYWNKNEGGVIGYKSNKYEMKPTKVYIIPPNTPYYSYYLHQPSQQKYKVIGKRVDVDEDEHIIEKHSLLHLYIHFNLGLPFDNVEPNIYDVDIDTFQQTDLMYLKEYLKQTNNFNNKVNIQLQSQIYSFLAKLPDIWSVKTIDDRVLKIIRHIDRNITENYTNKQLADTVYMATNSFSRIFKENMGMPLQYFIKERKINTACGLFDHSNLTIEEVAHKLGFFDRYHFSRIFKQVNGRYPGEYRKKGVL